MHKTQARWTTKMALLAGAGKACLNAPDGTPMGGYWGRKSGCTGVADDLHASCLALKEEGPLQILHVFIFSLDLIGISSRTSAELAAVVSDATGIPPGPALSVFVSCTHTHTGPQTHSSFIGMSHASDEEYMVPILRVGTARTHGL